MALMGFDAADTPSPILFHQTTIQPGTGTVVHRAPILFGITGSSAFDDAIFQTDHQNLDKLFKPSMEEGIWTAADIINHCVSTQATTTPTTPPVVFDKNKLDILVVHILSKKGAQLLRQTTNGSKSPLAGTGDSNKSPSNGVLLLLLEETFWLLFCCRRAATEEAEHHHNWVDLAVVRIEGRLLLFRQ